MDLCLANCVECVEETVFFFAPFFFLDITTHPFVLLSLCLFSTRNPGRNFWHFGWFFLLKMQLRQILL